MRTLTDVEAAAYRAPFPSPDYQAGALAFPRLVPIRPDHPGAYENRIAIERLKRLESAGIAAVGRRRSDAG